MVLVSFSVKDVDNAYSFDWTFKWIPTAAVMDGDDLYLRFIAVDDYGSGTYYWPQLEVCACMNGATCSFDYLSTKQHHFNPGAEPLFLNSHPYSSFGTVTYLIFFFNLTYLF